MRSAAPMKFAKTGYMIVSALLFAMGIMLIAFPGFSVSLFGILCGIILIIFGIVRLVGYFSKDLYRLAFQYDLAFGIMMIALGIMLLVRPESSMNFICIALGLLFLLDSIFKIQISFDAKTFGVKRWWMILACAVVSGIFSIVLLFRPGKSSRVLTVMFGITFLLEAILNLCTVLTAVKIINHQHPDIIDVDYTESED